MIFGHLDCFAKGESNWMQYKSLQASQVQKTSWGLVEIVVVVCGKICGNMCGKMCSKIGKLSDWNTNWCGSRY